MPTNESKEWPGPTALDIDGQAGSSHAEHSAFELALEHQLAGRWDAAEGLYRAMLAADPGHAEALHFFGVLRHQQGHGDEGRALVQQSLALQPHRPDWHNTLGNMLSAQGSSEEAVAAFMAALELDARHIHAWNNLGAVLLTLRHAQEAIVALRNAVELDPSFRAAHQNLGDAWRQAGDAHAAALCYCAEYVLRPAEERRRDILGIAYSQLGRHEEAAQVYAAWLVDEPDHPIASHLLAASRGHAPLDRAPSEYLQSYFDAYADTFEQKLVSDLEYSVPPLIGDMLAALQTPAYSLRILDAGCGTGLCGPQLRPFAKQLEGVDLSTKSLVIAEEKGVYDSLHSRDIADHLSACAPASWDLLVAADVWIYFGNLLPIMAAAHAALASGGQLLASFEVQAETADGESETSMESGYVLQPSGRYSHRKDYLLRTLQECGFTVLEMKSLAIRKELGRPVKGLLLMATRTA